MFFYFVFATFFHLIFTTRDRQILHADPFKNNAISDEKTNNETDSFQYVKSIFS